MLIEPLCNFYWYNFPYKWTFLSGVYDSQGNFLKKLKGFFVESLDVQLPIEVLKKNLKNKVHKANKIQHSLK